MQAPQEADHEYFYPRPPRGGRQEVFVLGEVTVSISIHALREEGDGLLIAPTRCLCNFYPRPPRGGRPPASSGRSGCWTYFYPRPPRGGRLAKYDQQFLSIFISIHALREEGDSGSGGASARRRNFYPRPPRGGRPSTTIGTTKFWNFYPRPPRGGRPSSRPPEPPSTINFYPRPPRGGRRLNGGYWDNEEVFLSTPSARRATSDPGVHIEIGGYFYPRPPRGGRP